MKLSERLYLGSYEVSPISVICNLAYRSPGSAAIITNREPNMKQLVAYECGYNNRLTRWFTGYVESYKQINDNVYTLFCRELAGVLRNPLPVSMQHKTLTEVLNQVTDLTGVEFVVPGQNYANTPAPHIINHGSGYTLLDSLGHTFSIERYVWQQQGDGRVYIGSWNDSVWSDVDIPLPHEFIENAQINSAQIPMDPLLRPGVLINGQRVRNIQLQKEKMHITWI